MNVAPNPPGFTSHLQSVGYHSRSSRHSDALSECVVDDLFRNCPAIADRARTGRIVYDLNFTLRAGTADWNVDLVLGEPPPGSPVGIVEGIPRLTPSTIHIAVEHKSVMTEHRKAIKNRKRDFEAHHEHVHRYSRDALVGRRPRRERGA